MGKSLILVAFLLIISISIGATAANDTKNTPVPVPDTKTPTPVTYPKNTPPPVPETKTPTPVVAPKNPPTPVPAPKPVTPVPAPKPKTPAPAPAPKPKTPAPAPKPKTPAPAPKPKTPAPAPKPKTPAPAPKPKTPAPAPKPKTPAPAPKPKTPAPAPKPKTPAPAPKPKTPAPAPKPKTPAPAPKPKTPAPAPKPKTPAPAPKPKTPAPPPKPKTPAPAPKPKPPQDDATNYDDLTPDPKTGCERAFCKSKKACYYKTLTCPKECPERKPKKNKKSKGCFINCGSKCEATCKWRRPKCNGYGSLCYDPRFVGGDGVMFYFHGGKGRDFALVSDTNLQINGHFIGNRPNGRRRDYTWVQSVSIMFDTHTLIISAKKAAQWDDTVDMLLVKWEGEEVTVPFDGDAEWRTDTGVREVVVERTDDTNAVKVTVGGLVTIDMKAVPVTKEDDKAHNYQLPSNDAFAHFELQFNFLNLSDEVEGILGKTYRPGYVSPVKRGIAMPIMGGEDKYETPSLTSTLCKQCKFQIQSESALDTDTNTDIVSISIGATAANDTKNTPVPVSANKTPAPVTSTKNTPPPVSATKTPTPVAALQNPSTFKPAPAPEPKPKTPAPAPKPKAPAPATKPKAPAPAPKPKASAPTPKPTAHTSPHKPRTPALAPKPKTPTPAPKPKTPAPAPKTPAPKPKTPAPAPKPKTPTPAPKPKTPAPAPKPNTPTHAPKPNTPAPAPKPKTPAPAPKPKTPAPAPKPKTPIPTPKPKTPAPAPKPKTPAPAPKPKTPAPAPKPKTTTPAPKPKPKPPQDDCTNYDELTPDPKAGRERAFCKAKGACYYKTLTCPKECPTRKPKKNKKNKGCLINCGSKCEATCKWRRPKCNGYGSLCYDPRFVGGDGVMFYFHGGKGRDFALVSDTNLQINGHFIGSRPNGRHRDYTWVQSVSIMFDTHTLVLSAKKAAQWDDMVDMLLVKWEGEEVTVPLDGDAEWKTDTGVREVVVERTDDTNAVKVTVGGLVTIDMKAVPVTKEDDKAHNYQLPSNDAFAHFELQFNFLNLSDEVEGILGKTYRSGYVSPVKRGIAMPIMGGEDKYETPSLTSSLCKQCKFQMQSESALNTDTDDIGISQY
ncbi:hypothetical protein SSX86_000753 [Deinandra increscens subsp. villosa]|uniref:Uncharacterized protein n=1 Tax=Deinandra increscens subsp. villosa TaxID=3103831 RepID=A0AAP0DTR3_9ASTR